MSDQNNNQENARIIDVYDEYMSNDAFKDKWTSNNLGNQYISKERFVKIQGIFQRYSFHLQDKKILEVGCAGGGVMGSLIKLGAVEDNIYGIDIRKNRIKDAKKALPNCHFLVMDAANLDFSPDAFELITVSTLFSSILNTSTRRKIASEIYRVLKPGGAVLYYDFRYNNPTNKNVVGIKMREINKLFPNMNKYLQLITLLPPLARRMGKATPFLYPTFSIVPLIKTHYLGFFIK